MKKQSNIYLIVLLLVCGLLGFGYYSVYKKIQQSNRLQAEVNYYQANISQLNNLRLTVPTLLSVKELWLKTMPSTEDEVAVFASMAEQIAKSNNLTIVINFDDFPTGVDIGGREVSGLGADITIDGGYQNLTNFLSSLSNLPYFYKIDKLTIVKHETKSGVKAIINGVLITNFEIK